MELKYIKSTKLVDKKVSDWFLVGKVWQHKTKADCLSGRFGLKVKDTAGELQDVFSEITIKAGDPIMIRANTHMRADKKDPSYLMYMLKDSAK